MSVYVSNLQINAGTDFSQVFTLEDGSTNLALKLNNYSVKSQMRKHATATGVTTFTSSIENSAAGQIKIGLSASQTASLKEGRYVYDVVITDSSSVMTRVIEGMALVRAGVTKF